MAAATTTAVSKLKSLIECPVCLETFEDPRILPCQHSFCLSCLQGTWASKEPRDIVYCPFCRERFVIPGEGICGIRKDHRANATKDVYQNIKANRTHFCDQHKDKALDIYCRGCKAAICSSCLVKDHYGHSVFEVCEFSETARKQMTKELEKLAEYQANMNERKARVQKYNYRFLKEIDTTEKAINKKAEELKQLIEQQRLLLAEELCIVKEKHLNKITKARIEMDKHSAEIESMKCLCNAVAQLENPIEISRAMTKFHSASDKLAENHQVQLERPLPLTKISFQPTTSREVQSRKNIIGSITAVPMRLIEAFNVSEISGLTKLESNVYVLRSRANLIAVYNDQIPFRLQEEIHIKEIKIAVDIASSEKSKCLYVTDSVNNCIWKVTVNDHRVTRWLSDVGDPFTLSVTSDDHILKLRDGGHHSQLEIYGSYANLIRILPLSTDIQWPLHAVQKPSGQFTIIHKATARNSDPWIISQLTSDGKLNSRYCFKDSGQFIFYLWHLSLDLEKDRVFLAGYSHDGVILLDSTSDGWIQLRIAGKESYCCDACCSRVLPIHYDTSKKQLLVGQTSGILNVYDLS